MTLGELGKFTLGELDHFTLGELSLPIDEFICHIRDSDIPISAETYEKLLSIAGKLGISEKPPSNGILSTSDKIAILGIIIQILISILSGQMNTEKICETLNVIYVETTNNYQSTTQNTLDICNDVLQALGSLQEQKTE